MTRRREFSKQTKKDALRRSGGFCEGSGEGYGLAAGKRCNAPLSFGVEFDHIIADSIGGDATLENCAAVCRDCHGFKTAKIDTPRAAKVKRIADKHAGIRTKPSRPLPGTKASGIRKRFNGSVERWS